MGKKIPEEKSRRAVITQALLAVCTLAAGWTAGSFGRTIPGDRAVVRDGAELSGSIRMAGSTSMEGLAYALAEGFMEKYPDVNVTVEFVGSGAGILSVLSGTTDIGNSSRELKQEEKDKGAAANIVALDGIVVCTDPANEVRSLTKQQLADIYTGAVTNWSQVGGAEFPVVVVGHQAGSGTREAFEKLMGLDDTCIYANELGSNGAVLAKVASTPGAVGYLSLDAADDSVNILSLEGVEPSRENIRDGSYALCRPFLMVTRGELSSQNRLVRAWFDYVFSREGRAVTERMGLIPAD